MACNSTMGNIIGKAIVRVVEDLEKDEMARGEFMRIQVCLDVSKPLLRGKKICVGSSQPIWVCFTYEHLPNLYYIRGLLGHSHRDCDHWTEAMNKLNVSNFPYGPWLHVGGLRGFGGSMHSCFIQQNDKKGSPEHITILAAGDSLVNTHKEVSYDHSKSEEFLEKIMHEINERNLPLICR